MARHRGSDAVVVLGTLMVMCVLGGCASGGADRQVPSSSDVPMVEIPALSPLTGQQSDLRRGVVIVKIDNVAEARPQLGVAGADVVYVEPVEGGLTRLAAVYQSGYPDVVGPVRSARETDLELFANYGRPTMAFSGEAPELSSRIAAAPVVDGSAPTHPGAYFHTSQRSAPYNTYVRPGELPAGSPPRDIGFGFGPSPELGIAVSATAARYPGTVVGIEWRPAEGGWVFAIDGAALIDADGARPAAATVVLQRVQVHDGSIRDATGAVSPVARTVGSGPATVLRDGREFAATWQRGAPHEPTVFTGASGAPIPFAPGPVWVFLLAQ